MAQREATEVRPKRRTFASLRFRNYRLYFFSQIVSFSGTWMQSLAVAWLVLQLTGSGTALGTVMAARFVPTLFLAPLGGVIADRLDKRQLIATTQALQSVLALVLGLVTVTGVVELWMVYVPPDSARSRHSITRADRPSLWRWSGPTTSATPSPSTAL